MTTGATVTNAQIYRELIEFREETRTKQAVFERRMIEVEQVSCENKKAIHGNGQIGMDEMIRDIYNKLLAQETKHNDDLKVAREKEDNKTATFRWWWEKVISPFVMPVLIAWAIVQFSL